MSEVDELISWSDLYDHGSMRNTQPFISALKRRSIANDIRTESRIEALQCDLITKVKNDNKINDSNNDTDNDWDPNEIAETILNRLKLQEFKSNSNNIRYKNNSVVQGINIAQQLIPFKAHTISKCQNIFRSEVDVIKIENEQQLQKLRQLEHERNQLLSENARPNNFMNDNNNNNNNNNQIRGNNNRKRSHNNTDNNNGFPFKSSTNVYKEEGGNIDHLRSKNNNNNNNNNSSNNNNSNKLLNASEKDKDKEEELPPELSHLDKALVARIEADIVVRGHPVTFDDIAGLDFAKTCVHELIVWPMTRPDIFTGLRALPKGILLFGPPGTGKTMVGKAIAHECNATFFNISASSLTSKWIGEGERTVRTLFELAAYKEPSVVFIDEVDSLMSSRNSNENEASRRMKTELFIQLDGAGNVGTISKSSDGSCHNDTNRAPRVVVLGATNCPDDLDEAARRRFVKRIYVPLPNCTGRRSLFNHLLNKSDAGGRGGHAVTREQLDVLVEKTAGYSGADLSNLCTEAALGPVREIAHANRGNLNHIKTTDIVQIADRHFIEALDTVAPSVSQNDLIRYKKWNDTFGTYKNLMEENLSSTSTRSGDSKNESNSTLEGDKIGDTTNTNTSHGTSYTDDNSKSQ